MAARGIDDGRTDFRRVFGEMGNQAARILTPGNDPKEIRKAFQLSSRSTQQAGGGGQAFSKLSGFGAYPEPLHQFEKAVA